MNHDDKNQGQNAANDLELEARVVAAVLGEASAFELAELDRLLAEKPELAVFKKRIEAVHGLVGRAEAIEKDPLKLSDERRSKLIQTLGGGERPKEDVKSPAVSPVAQYRRRKPWLRAVPIAAGLMIGLFVSAVIKYSQPGYKKPFRPAPSDTVLESRVDRSESSVNLQSVVDGRSAKEDDKLLPEDADRTSNLAQKSDATEPVVASQAGTMSTLPDGTVVMPKFEVNADQQGGGYLASNTLAGTRLHTEIPALTNGITLRGDASSRELRDLASSEAAGQKKAYGWNAKEKSSVLFGTGSPTGTLSAKTEQAFNEPRAGLEPGSAAPTSLASNDSHFSSDSKKALTYGVAENAKPLSTNTEGSVSRYSGGAQDGLGAQPTLADSETVVLSPFAVLAPEDKGYSSRSTLAGTRVSSAPAAPPASKPESAKADKDRSKAAPAPADAAKQIAPVPARSNESSGESRAAQQPVSTFSLHVSDVSFRLAQAALARGDVPDPASVRPEEFYNAFDYGDPAPSMNEKVSCRIEQSAHPTLQQRNLVRIAMKVPATGHAANQPLRLTVMLDTSGSMEREDRAAAVRQALATLVSLLGPNDRLTLIGFSRQPRLLAEDLPGNRAQQALDVLAHTPAEGGTNIEEALKLAQELARRHQTPGAQNRIVLLTDGAANLGDADPEKLAVSIEALRQQGIAFDACGVGTEGIDDSMLEALTRKGDGRYYVLNSAEAADASFARQLAGAFRPAAQNVKLQVRFNPSRVGAYRLIGFEQHRLKEEDFRNDNVDAAELAADEAAVAVYEVETLPQGEGEVGEVYVRFRDTVTGNMVERSWTLGYDAHVPAFDRASPSMQLAGVAALVAEKLKADAHSHTIKLDDLSGVANQLRGHYAHEQRVQQLVAMFEQLRRIDAK